MADAPLLIVSTMTDDDGIFVYRIADGDGRLELAHQFTDIVKPFFIALHPNIYCFYFRVYLIANIKRQLLGVHVFPLFSD